ncbi:MAG: dUTP diphosphatase, partial [Pseudomonadota bacterium]
QDHGYKDGSYIKVWNGQEDNEHLVEVVKSLDTEHADFAKLVYQGLEQRYPK